MKLFGKKTSQETDSTEAAATFDARPEKARAFFDRAQTVHDATNYPYAMTLWLQGLRLDPTSMTALEKFSASAAGFSENGQSKGPTKEQVSTVSGKGGQLDKYLHALLQWGARGFDWEWGLRAVEAAIKLDLEEQAYWIASNVLSQMMQDPKAKKNSLVRLMELFIEIGSYDKAVIAGDAARRLDPRDGKLEDIVKNLSAQATMHSGGFEDTSEGGFRRRIKDTDSQRRLIEEDSIVKSRQTLDDLIERYEKAHQAEPDDLPTVQKYVQYLLERGTPRDEKTAHDLLLQTFEKTDSYRFRQQAGEIKLRVARRKLRALRQALQENPDDEARRREHEQFAKGLLQEEIREYADRVQNYPTDLSLKFELGRRLFDTGRYEDAIQQFQVAQNAPGIAPTVQNYLGQAFLRLGWLAEAEDTYRGAIAGHASQKDDLGLNLRYGLMIVLQDKGAQEKELAAAEEAFRIASSIAIQQINFRDIRERRSQLQELVRKLKDAA